MLTHKKLLVVDGLIARTIFVMNNILSNNIDKGYI